MRVPQSAETLRKYPPIPGVIRRSNREYTFADSNVTIDRHMLVLVPVYAIHHDAAYYPEPERFDPDRFTPEAMRARPNEAFLPFGAGPRNCIGLRFARMQALIGLITVLRNFAVEPCAQTAVPLRFDKTSRFLTPADGLFLTFRPL